MRFKSYDTDPSIALYLASVCSAEGNEEVGGDDPQDAPKMISQEQVNALLAKERRSFETKLKAASELSDKASRADELEAKLAELEEERALAGKTAAEKERARAEKATQTMASEKARLEAEKATLAADLEKARSEHRMTLANHSLSVALSSAGVFASASEDALASFVQNSELEFDDSGALTAATSKLDGLRYDDFKKAAEAFLAKKPHFAAGSGGGSGTRLPGGGGVRSNKPLHELSTAELLKVDVQQRAQR